MNNEEPIKPFKVRHKKDGWTGEITVENITSRGGSSHRQYWNAVITLHQDEYKTNGEYVENPDVDFSELEVIEE